MRFHAKLPNLYWAEAAATSAYTQNKLPTFALKQETPYERWCNKKPDKKSVKDQYVIVCYYTEPSTLKEAMTSPNAKEWQEAANLEYESLMENETWDLGELPRDLKAKGSK